MRCCFWRPIWKSRSRQAFNSPQKGADNYAVTVSARKLQDILRALPDSADIALETQNNRILARSGKSRFTLQTLPAEDFPKLAAAGGAAVKVKVSAKGAARRCCCWCNMRWRSRTSAIT